MNECIHLVTQAIASVIRIDIQSINKKKAPRSALQYLVQLTYRRYRQGMSGFLGVLAGCVTSRSLRQLCQVPLASIKETALPRYNLRLTDTALLRYH
jgi:hypothetical protein